MATKAKAKRTAQRSARSKRRASRRSESFSRREAALLADVSLRSVDKAIEERVVKPRRSSKRVAALDSGDVLAIALIARAGLPLRAETKRQINQWVHGFLAEDKVDEAKELLLSEVLVLRYDDDARELAERLFAYLETRERFIESNPSVMGGEPVISGTRIPVRAVAVRIDGGNRSQTSARTTPKFLRRPSRRHSTYAQAHPRRGRPARPWRDARRASSSTRISRQSSPRSATTPAMTPAVSAIAACLTPATVRSPGFS